MSSTTTNPNSISASALQRSVPQPLPLELSLTQNSLKTGPKIRIYWSATPSKLETRQILIEAFYKSVLAYFSVVFKNGFMASSTPDWIVKNAKGEVVSVILSFPHKKDVLKAIQWMIDSCAGKGFDHVPATTYPEVVRMKQVCDTYQITVLRQFVATRMDVFKTSPMPLDQVKAFYANLSLASDKDAKAVLIRSIGQAVFKDYLVGKAEYQKYGKEVNRPFFDDVQKWVLDRTPKPRPPPKKRVQSSYKGKNHDGRKRGGLRGEEQQLPAPVQQVTQVGRGWHQG